MTVRLSLLSELSLPDSECVTFSGTDHMTSLRGKAASSQLYQMKS